MRLAMLSIIAIISVLTMIWQIDFLNEKFNLNPGIPNVLLIFLTIIGILVWSYWLFFKARIRWLAVLVAGLPLLFVVFFHPDFGGDANIVGWKPRFWNHRPQLALPSVGESSRLDPLADPSIDSRADLRSTGLDDFPQFLGLNRDGKVTGVALSGDWKSQPPRLLWRQDIGEGWSGFAVVNGYAVTQEQRGELECVTCYRIDDGQLVWIHASPRRHEDRVGLGKVGPRATPTIDQGLVYTMGGTGILDCIDGSNGQLLWSQDIPALVGITLTKTSNSMGLKFSEEDSTLMWGRAGSPLIFNDKVIVTAGGSRRSADQTATLIAFDKTSGEEIWRGGNRMISYGSPTLATLAGDPQILLITEDHAVGHHPETGAELWSHLRPGNSGQDANCSQVTPISENQLLFSKGYNLGGEVIELSMNPTSQSFQVNVIAKDSRVLKTKLTNPVHDGQFAYSLSDGFLECVEIPGLKRRWKQRGRFGNGQILLVGDKLLIHSEDGELVLAEASPDSFQPLGSIKTISGTCWNTISLVGNRVLVRSEREMACFELPLRSAVTSPTAVQTGSALNLESNQ